MNLATCPGCHKKFGKGVGIRVHQRSCRELLSGARGIYQKREKNLERPEVVKIPRQDVLALADIADQRQDIRDKVNFDFELPRAGSSKITVSPSPPVPEPLEEPCNLDLPRLRPRKPRAIHDELPPHPPLIPEPDMEDLAEDLQDERIESQQSDLNSDSTGPFRTECDSYGIYREYSHGKPTITPDRHYNLSDISDSPYLSLDSSASQASSSLLGLSLQKARQTVDALKPFFAPFRNPTVYRLMDWFYNCTVTKSLQDLNKLVKNVLLASDFKQEDLMGFSAQKENELMDTHRESTGEILGSSGSDSESDNLSSFKFDDTWIKGSVEIPLPCDGIKQSEAQAPKFVVEVYYRKITEVIKSALSEPAAEHFHTFPFQAFWKPAPDEPRERIYSEIYTGDFWNYEYDKLRTAHERGPNNALEAFIIALMIWSDSTSLAQFGNASLWPIYLYIGNQSKYFRAKPSSFAAHHIAYIPKLGDRIQEFYKEAFGKTATAAMLTHLRRELPHAIWMLLMDDDFMHVYIHGLVFQLVDGIMRLAFPRFLIYSADYPEKMLMACLRYLALCPCPRCLLLKSKIPLIGLKTDLKQRIKLLRMDSDARRETIEIARRLMFEEGINITSKRIEELLRPHSLVPTRNAFSERLFENDADFNFYQMFVPDLLHEFELGVWKAVFTHLIRILYACGGDKIQTLNSRYRQISSFGRDTIRRFNGNVSAMKKLAARDWEDLLQCAIPAFEDLLPTRQHNTIVRKLLFELATWHGFAKLRLHTETTVVDLENSTKRLGDALRTFQDVVCGAYKTYELPQEEAARGRREAAAAKKNSTLPNSTQSKTVTKKPSSGRRQRQFNLNTYKTHALGDYANAIRLFGTSDNFNSQTGELEHRRGKRCYKRVHKGKFIVGIGKQVRRERLMHLLRERNKQRRQTAAVDRDDLPTVPFEEEEILPATSPKQHHHISTDNRQKVQVAQWVHKNKEDPAIKDFIPRLKNHLLSRLENRKYDGDELNYSANDRRDVVISGNTIFRHKVLRVNYTTYDMRRSQDSINPRLPGHGDIMVLSPENESDNEDPHPYWYARILGIYHCHVHYRKSPEPKRMEFLFVRWFGRDMDPEPGWKAKRLLRLGFVPGNDETAFGFLDPAQVIRAVHLIPAFVWGHVTKYLPGSSPIARGLKDPDDDWQLYYVNMFADRDLMMRFRGGGVGHKSTREATDAFKKDRDLIDERAQLERRLGVDDEPRADEDDWVDEGDENNNLEDLDDAESVNEELEEDYGYIQEESDGEPSTDEDLELANQVDEVDDEDFGPEDDGGAVDPDMDDLGYAEM